MDTTEQLKRTPLYAAHVEAGAKMVPFGGWEMPVVYSSILEEHAAVRESVGLFDISHMGELLVAGPRSEQALNDLFTNDIRKAAIGQAQYTLMCNYRGGVIDDLIAYRLEPSVYLIIVNASHIEQDFAWMQNNSTAPAVVENLSDRFAALALQGPYAANFFEFSHTLHPFHIQRASVFGKECWVARTGYTGEEGFEIFCASEEAPHLWKMILGWGEQFGIQPCGLGARDTLRLEMCYPLNGNDMTEETTPLEAGLGKFVSFEKGEFVGRDVLLQQKDQGVDRKLIAFKMTEKSPPPRPHYPIMTASENARATREIPSSEKTTGVGPAKIGEITSGTQSPTMGIGIGMGYVESKAAAPGSKIGIEIRGKTYAATIEKKPLLKRNP